MFGMSKPAKPAKRADKQPAPGKAAQPEADDHEAAVELTLKLTPARLEKLQRLGGAAWIALQIDKAKAPTGAAKKQDKRTTGR